MKKGDLIWGLILLAFASFIILPGTHQIFMDFTSTHPYIGGFIKFSILATLGEMLAGRIIHGDYKKPHGFWERFIVWGLIGMLITLMFQIFSSGVSSAMEKGLLPGEGSRFLFAIYTSTIMNMTFGPTFMAFHRYTDTLLDLRGENKKMPSSSEVLTAIDWKGFVSFVVFKTIPLFRLPAHTITFMLDPQYRVLLAAALSLALGVILAFAKTKGSDNK